jgi:hypothetical protein
VWKWSGYNEIQNPKQRYATINYNRLANLLGLDSISMLKKVHAKLVDDVLKADRYGRDRKWSTAIAVGSEDYIDHIKKELGIKVVHRKKNRINKDFELREDEFPYSADFDLQKAGLRQDNRLFWDIYS